MDVVILSFVLFACSWQIPRKTIHDGCLAQTFMIIRIIRQVTAEFDAKQKKTTNTRNLFAAYFVIGCVQKNQTYFFIIRVEQRYNLLKIKNKWRFSEAITFLSWIDLLITCSAGTPISMSFLCDAICVAMIVRSWSVHGKKKVVRIRE